MCKELSREECSLLIIIEFFEFAVFYLLFGKGKDLIHSCIKVINASFFSEYVGLRRMAVFFVFLWEEGFLVVLVGV